MPSQPNDAPLVQQAIAGDREAFGDLYEMHLDSIYRYLLYRVSDEREAEDLTETVFLKAWEALDRYQPSAIPFTAWLYRIAHNLLIDRHRAHKMTDTLDEELADPQTDPETRALRNVDAAVIVQALTQLEPSHQQVLTLRFINGHTHTETAQIMERSEANVRVLQHRALTALRRLAAGKIEHD
jgi:RNA polymerase sigma-70 factor (ECF subfamily)